MKTTVMVVAALAAGGAFGFGMSVRAQDGDAFLGSVRARAYTQTYKMPLDVGADRTWKPPERIDERRRRIHISDLYGEMVDMTAHGDSVVMWFKDDEGVLRNAVVPNVSSELLHIERAPARQITITYR